MAQVDKPSDPGLVAPLPVRIGAAVALALVVAGAAYLYAVRGTAMILDMASDIGRMLCL